MSVALMSSCDGVTHETPTMTGVRLPLTH